MIGRTLATLLVVLFDPIDPPSTGDDTLPGWAGGHSLPGTMR